MKKHIDLRQSCLFTLLVIMLNVNVAESKWCMSQLIIISNPNGMPMQMPGGGFNPYAVNSVLYLFPGDTVWLMFSTGGEDCDTSIINHPLLLKNGVIEDSLQMASGNAESASFDFPMTDTGHYSIGYWEDLGSGQLELVIVDDFQVIYSPCELSLLAPTYQLSINISPMQNNALLWLAEADTIWLNYQYQWGNNSFLQFDTVYLFKNDELIGTFIDPTPCSNQVISIPVFEEGFYELSCKDLSSSSSSGLSLLKCFSVYNGNYGCYSSSQFSYCQLVNSSGSNIYNATFWQYLNAPLHFDLTFHYASVSNYMLDTIFVYKNYALYEPIPVDSPCYSNSVPLVFNEEGFYQLMYKQCASYLTGNAYYTTFSSFTILASNSPCPTPSSSGGHYFTDTSNIVMTAGDQWIQSGDTLVVNCHYQWGNEGCYRYDTLYVYKDGGLWQMLVDPTPCETNEIAIYLSEQGFYEIKVNSMCVQNSLTTLTFYELWHSVSPCITTTTSYSFGVVDSGGNNVTSGGIVWLPPGEELDYAYVYKWAFECCYQLDSVLLFRDNMLLQQLYDNTPCDTFQIPFLIDAPGNYFILIPEKCYSAFDTIFQIEVIQSASPCFTASPQCNYSVESPGFATLPSIIEMGAAGTVSLLYSYDWGNECNWKMDELILYRNGMFFDLYQDFTPCETPEIPIVFQQEGFYEGYIYDISSAAVLSSVFSLSVIDTTNNPYVLDFPEANHAGALSIANGLLQQDYFDHVSVKLGESIVFSIDCGKEAIHSFIFNTLGQKCFESKATGIYETEAVDIKGWHSGMYLLVAITSVGWDVEKIILQ